MIIIGHKDYQLQNNRTLIRFFDYFERYLGQGFIRLFLKITNYTLGLDGGGWYGHHIIVFSKTSYHHVSIQGPNILLEHGF